MPSVTAQDGSNLHYCLYDFTDPWLDRPYVILQHGFGRSSKFRFAVVPYLARHYRLICPDLRGLGESTLSGSVESITVENYLADLISIADHVGARNFHYVGESLGGTIGFVLAARRPERIRTLSVLGAPIFINQWMREAYAVEHSSWASAIRALGAEGWARRSNSAARFPSDGDSDLLDWYSREIGKADVEVLVAMTAVATGIDAKPFLDRIKAPVLALYPAQGRIANHEQLQILLNLVPDIHLAKLRTRYQMLHMLYPAACANRVLSFLSLKDGFVDLT